jgi:hypothetical protein
MPAPTPIVLTYPNGRQVPIRPRDIYMVTSGSERHIAVADVLVRERTTGRTFRARETTEEILRKAPGQDWVNLTDDQGRSHEVNFSAVTDTVRRSGPGSRFVELRFSSACSRYFSENRALTERLDAAPARPTVVLEE